MSSIKEKLEELVDLEKLSRKIDVEKFGRKIDLEAIKEKLDPAKIKEYAQTPEGKRTKKILITVLAIVGVIVLASIVAFCVHHYLTPSYTGDEDDFEDA